MPWAIPLAAAAVTAGAGLYQSNQASKAAKSAANAQIAGQQAAIGEQQREFDINQQNLSPWLTAGKSALDAQLALLGLGHLTGPGGGAAPTVGGYNIDKIMSDPAYADVVQWAQSGHGDPNTPMDQQSIADRINYWIHNGISQNDPRAINAPTYTADDVAAAGPAAAQSAAIEGLKNSPLYQSLYRNGQNTILANASATGGLRGGNIQSSLANFGADTLASVIQNQLQNLGGISGQGANTGGVLGQLGSGTSANISSLLAQQGAARGGGILASSGIQAGGLSNALQSLLQGAGQSYAAYRAAAGTTPQGAIPVDPYAAGVI